MAEELKQQLGEQLPGSIRIFADALGVTEQELFDRMEKGLLKPAEVLPLVAKEFRKASEAGGGFAKATQSVAAEQNRLANAWADMVKNIQGSAFWTALAKVFGTLSQILNTLTPIVTTLSDAIGGFMLVLWQMSQPLLTLLQAGTSLLGWLNSATDGWVAMAAGALLAAKAIQAVTKALKLNPLFAIGTAALAGVDFLSSQFTADGKGFLAKGSDYLTQQANPFGGGATVNQTNYIQGTDGAGIAASIAESNRSYR